MQPWLVRGVAMGVVNAIAQTIVAMFAVNHPTNSVVQPVAIALLVGVALLWGGIDGWLRRFPRRGMAWFYGALIGGELAGVLGVIGQGVLVDQTGTSALWPAMTGGAAFTALLIMAPGALGLLVGGRLQAPPGAIDEDEDRPSTTPSPAATARLRAQAARAQAMRAQGRRSVRSSPRG